MNKVALLLVALFQVSISWAQSQTWNVMVEPDNTNSAFKRHRYFANGQGWTFEEYSRFQVFQTTVDGGQTWTLGTPPLRNGAETLFGLLSLDEDNMLSLFASPINGRFSVKHYNKSEDIIWEELGKHSVPDITPVFISSDKVWMKAVSTDFVYGSVYGTDANNDFGDYPFVLTNNVQDILLVRDKISDPFEYLIDMEFYDNKTGLIVTKYRNVYTLNMTTDGGASWSKVGDIDAGDFGEIEMPNASTYYVSVTNGLYVTTDAGKTWTTKSITGATSIRTMKFASEKCGVAIDRTANGSYTIKRTTDGGNTWIDDQVSMDVPDYQVSDEIYSVEYIDCTHWFAVTSRHVISNTGVPFTTASSIDESNDGLTEVTAYPNPANTSIQFDASTLAYEIHNIQGKVVLTGEGNIAVGLGSLPNGSYYARLRHGADGFSSMINFVVQH